MVKLYVCKQNFFFLGGGAGRGGGHIRGDVDMDGMVKVVYRRSVFKICVVGDSSFVVAFRVLPVAVFCCASV